MKKVFLGLTAATILYAVYNVIIDIKDVSLMALPL